MRRVIIESPYAGDITHNLRYLRACMADCLSRGEAPFASHALYTQPGVLDDNIPAERKKGIEAGYAWWGAVEAVIFYTDLGWSKGMEAAAERVEKLAPSLYEERQLGPDWAHQTAPNSRLRCGAYCVEARCDRVASSTRDGWPVCWQHAKNQKFRPHPTAVRIDVINFTPPGGVEHGRWYFTEVV